MKTIVVAVALVLCATAALGDQQREGELQDLEYRPYWWPRREDLDQEAKEKVLFELFTRDNPDEEELLTVSEQLKAAQNNFNATRPTKILVHGWHSRQTHPHELRKAFLEVMDVNVILVNWHDMDSLNYFSTVTKLRPIARRVAALVDFLRDSYGVLPEDLHIIGHSLGAHISGLSSQYIKSGRIGRITGLDPAGPLIRNNPKYRLDKSHAVFVDVIHTCGNVLGRRKPIGHVDFYPNGGKCSQPGCGVEDLERGGTCSHVRSFLLFGETILQNDSLVAVPSKPFRSWPCKEVDQGGKKVVMGLGTPVSARGVYCLSTRSSSPFGYGFNMTMNSVRGSEREPSRREASIMLSKFMTRD